MPPQSPFQPKRRMSLKTGAPARKLRFTSGMTTEEVVEWILEAQQQVQYSVLSFDECYLNSPICNAMVEFFQSMSRRGRYLDRLNVEFCSGPAVDLILTSGLLLETIKHLFVASDDRHPEEFMIRLAATLRINASLKGLWLLIPLSLPTATVLGEALSYNDSLDKLSLSGSNWDLLVLSSSSSTLRGDPNISVDGDDVFYDTDDGGFAEGDDDDEDNNDDNHRRGKNSASQTVAMEIQKRRLKVPQALATGLRQNVGLRTIDLSCCSLRDDVACILVEALIGHPHLETLDLSRNHCQERTILALSEILAHPDTKLTTLDLREQCGRIDEEDDEEEDDEEYEGYGQQTKSRKPRGKGQYPPLDITALSNALMNNDVLTTLKLSHNRLNDSAIGNLVRNLQGNETLQELDLQYNEITARGLKALTQGLSDLPALKVLLLGGNAFGKEGNKLLAQLEDDDDSVCTIMEQQGPTKSQRRSQAAGKQTVAEEDSDVYYTDEDDTFHSATSRSKGSTSYKSFSKTLMGGLTGISER